MRIRYLVIHAAYTTPSMDIGVKEINRWHKNRGWNGVGYHYVIRRTGEVEEGRAENVQGAHVYGYNGLSLGICLVGGKMEGDEQPDCNFTVAQWSSLLRLMADLKARYPDAEILGHRDLDAGRACPCFDAKAWAVHLDAESEDIPT